MSNIKEFLNNDSIIYGLDFNQISLYFLLFNTNSNYGKELIKTFEKCDELKIKYDEINDFFTIRNIKISHITSEKQEIIKEISNDYLNERVFLVYNSDEIILSDFNYLNENSIILGVFLKEYSEFSEWFKETNKINVSKFKEEASNEYVSGVILTIREDEKQADEEDKSDENYDKEFDDSQDVDEFEEEISKKKSNKKNKSIVNEYDDEDEGPRRRKKDIDQSKISSDVTKFMATLRVAIEEDNKSFLKKLPVLNKLKLISPIEKFLANFHYQKMFLNMGGLDILQEFIKKNKDGTYPVFNQISKALDIISRLNVTMIHLENSTIGSYIMNLSKNMKESKGIQKMATEIIEKWSRIVWNINTNYADLESENRNYHNIFLSSKRNRNEGIEESKSRKDDKHEANIYKHARIPKKTLFDFTVKPISNIGDFKQEDNFKNIQSLFNARNAPGRKKD